jgi:hypothetical protein
VIDKTAIGIEALTVMPTLSARYTDEAAKTIPRIAPTNNRPKSEFAHFCFGGYEWLEIRIRHNSISYRLQPRHTKVTISNLKQTGNYYVEGEGGNMLE